MNPSNNRGPPPSFKTNVNRAKTKRWVEAKSYTYDGDDWGDADEYDEYNDYEPEPSQPPGVRQSGPAGAPYGPASHAGPEPVMQGPMGRGRTNSFGPDDEQAFPGPQPKHTAYAQLQQPPGGAPPPGAQPGRGQSGFPPSQGPPPQQGYPHPAQQQQHRRPSVDGQGRPAPPGPGGYPGYPPRGGNGSRTASMTSNASAGNQFRDFSNVSAMPPALQTQRPPRKSSLSQPEGLPGTQSPDQVISPVTDASDNVLPGSQQRERTASGSTPTFVRPADIYRRMQEEKERLSQESARPSLDAINKSRDESPAKSGDGSGHQRMSTLEPVAERRSEYGMEGLLAANPAVEDKPPSRGPSGSPMLPDLKGFGEGFGDDFGVSFTDSEGKPSSAPSKAQETSSRDSDSQPAKPHSMTAPVRKDTASTTSTVTATLSPRAESGGDGPLQHQPSLGFRSAVHTAFDQPIRQKSSATDSTVGRSNSDSTNAVSPINTRPESFHEPERPATILEEPSVVSMRRGTGDTVTAPRPFAMDDTRRSSTGSIPGFAPGHRRDMNTPSPNNSPARTPVLESNKQLPNPLEAELDLTTPSTADRASIEHDRSQPVTRSARASRELPQLVTPTKAQVGSGTSTPKSRAESPTKGHVRNLTDKFENTSSQGSNSPVKESPVKDSLRPREESPARNDSFRPGMPGGWVSYAPSVASSQPPPGPSAASRTGSAASADPTKGPFAAAAAAGSALAGAFLTATGVEQGPDTKADQGSNKKPDSGGRSVVQNAAIHPDAERVRASVDDNASSVEPTPLELGHGNDSKRSSAYFAPVAPLKQKAVRNASGQQLPTLPQVPTDEALSVDNSPNDQESDRLRKELVRELSPQTESFGKDALETPSAQQPKTASQDPRSSSVTRDSSILPSEYDSYWAGSPPGTGAKQQAGQKTPDAAKSNLFPVVPAPQEGPIKPFDIHGVASLPTTENQTGQAGESGRPMLQQRFSWETPLEDHHPSPASPPRVASNAPPHGMGSTGSTSIALAPMSKLAVERPAAELDAGNTTIDVDTDKTLPVAPGAPSSPVGVPYATGSRTSLPQMPGSTSPQDLMGGPLPPAPFMSQQAPDSGLPRDVMGGSLPPAPFTNQQKVASFKEIMAFKSPADRINKFNETREQVANEESGLDQWIDYMMQNVQDHADAIRIASAPQQQPIMASAPAATATSTPFGAPGSTTGPSPASGKSRPTIPTMNTSKAKEMFSSGGKAGKSKAKELFSKGRSKFRSSGGGEKALPRSRATPVASSPVSPTTNTHRPSHPPRSQSLSYSSITKASPLQSLSNVSTPKTHQLPSNKSDVPSPATPSLPPLSKVSTRRSNPPSSPGVPNSERKTSASSPGSSNPNRHSHPSFSLPISHPDPVPPNGTSPSPPLPRLRTWYPPRPARQSQASDADSPTLGLDEQIHLRTISQVSAEKPLLSLEEAERQQAAEQQSRLDVLTRLTVHQEEMGSFGASFPANLVSQPPPPVPALPAAYANDGRTPTQADFGGKGQRGPATGPPRTISRKRVQPDLRGSGGQPLQVPGANGHTDFGELRPFSFIRFDDVPAEEFAIHTPITPKASTFELNKLHGQGLRKGDSPPPVPPLPVKGDAALGAIPKTPPQKKPSGKRKPGSLSASRDTSASSSVQRSGSSVPSRSASHSNLAHNAERNGHEISGITPPSRSSRGRKSSRRSSDRGNAISESPEMRQASGSGQKISPGYGQSPLRSRKQRHHSLLKGLGINMSTPERATPERRMPKESIQEMSPSAEESPLPPPKAGITFDEASQPEPRDTSATFWKPGKSSTLPFHLRSISAALPPRANTGEQPQDKGKKRRFSNLGSFFAKPKFGPRKASWSKPQPDAPHTQSAPSQTPEQQRASPGPASAPPPPATYGHSPPAQPKEPRRAPQPRPFPPRRDSLQASPEPRSASRHSPHGSGPRTPPAARKTPTATVASAGPGLADLHPALRPQPHDAAGVGPAPPPVAADDGGYDSDHPPPPPPKDDKPAAHARSKSAPLAKQAAPPPPASPERARPQSLLGAFPTPPAAKQPSPEAAKDPSAEAASSPSPGAAKDPKSSQKDAESTAPSGSPRLPRKPRQSLPPIQTSPVVGAASKRATPSAVTVQSTSGSAETKGQKPLQNGHGASKSTAAPVTGASNKPEPEGVATSSQEAGQGSAPAEKDAPALKSKVLPSQAEKEAATTPKRAQSRDDDSDEEEIVMSSTAYPGQEWNPFGPWEGD